VDQATLDEFAQTGQASLLNGKLLPLEVSIGTYPWLPQQIDVTQ